MGSAARALAQAPQLTAEPGRTIQDTRGGGAQAFSIVSAILKNTRRIDVVLPPSFSKTGPDRRYPVAIVFDGEANVPVIAAVSDELTRQGLIPEIIYVAIENVDPMTGRVYDLTPPGLSVSGSDLNQGGDRFLDFIEQELLPAVDRQLRGAAPRIMIGHSSGAILATYAAATRPAFRGVIAVDGPVASQDFWLARKLIARAAGPPAAPLRYVAYESKFSWPESAWNELTAAAPPSWILHRERMRLEGHETLFMISTYLGLREIFADYSRLAASAKPATQMLSHYEAVSAAFGAPLMPPRRLLIDAMSDLISEGRSAEARAAYDRLVAGYGAPADAGSWTSRIAALQGQAAPTETVDGLLKTPFPTPDEARPFVGEWVGDIWMKPDQPRNKNLTLRIRVDNGRVIAEVKRANAPPEMAGWQPVDYLRITAGGLTWGMLNGMRPRGVRLWEGTLQGDTLAGTGRWGGIVFDEPPTVNPGFSLTRVKK